MLDIHTVGAGGGSIATIDNGLLKVGPRSAGAAPGPVCYGLGNDEPTVTDANVVLGVLNQTHLLGGRMAIDAAASRAAIARLADRLGLDLMATAQGIVRVVVANMAKAIRVISVERGYDPRDYTMLGFGGAGPIHAARLARELDIGRVLVPQNPGILCALGLLLTDLRTNLSMTRLGPLTVEAGPRIEAGFVQLEQRAAAWFALEAIAPERRVVARSVDMRYGGQGYELTVPCPDGAIDAAAIATLRAAFERAHRQVYGYVADEEPIQVTTLRLEATGLVPKAELPAHPSATTQAATAIIGERQVYLPETGGFTACPVYDRERLGPGHVVGGPAIVEQMDSTTLLLPGQVATVDAHLNLLIDETASPKVYQ
jgi:N-methylhydantoinase A